MGIGTAAGHALAEQLMAAAALARAKGAELSHRMRTEAQEIRTAHQRANELNGDRWASEAGRAYRRQLEEHREKIRNQAEQAEGTAAMIAAAGEELANDLITKAQAIEAAASAVDNLLGKIADGAAARSGPPRRRWRRRAWRRWAGPRSRSGRRAVRGCGPGRGRGRRRSGGR